MSKIELKKESIPKLLVGVRVKNDDIRDRTVLVAPERALALDDIGIAIMTEVDGEKTVAEIVQILADKYDAPLQTIGNDVVAFLRELIKLGYLGVSGDED